MKKLIIVFCLVFCVFSSLWAQVVFENNDQRWTFVGVKHTDQSTSISFDILIKNNRPGCFDAHKEDPENSSIFLSGVFGKYPIFESKFKGDYEPWVEWSGTIHRDYYDNKNKDKVAHATFIFSRIPAGVNVFDLHYNGGIGSEESDCEEYQCPVFEMIGLRVPDNENTAEQSKWTEASLIKYWTDNGVSNPIEGIYSFYNTNNEPWWGKIRHRLAIVKSEGVGYNIIYISGSNPGVWTEGEIKGNIFQSADKTLFAVNQWLIENKMNFKENLFIKRDELGFILFNSITEKQAKFVRIFPEL